MTAELYRTHEILAHDLDPEALQSVAIAVGWAYHSLYEGLKQNVALTNDMRLEMFARQRSDEVMKALAEVASRLQIPFDFKRLPCNGQNKLIIKMGRVLFMQEPLLALGDAPRVSDYKLEMAETYGLVRQLELDLGDDPKRMLDWGGQVFAVLLHGAYGTKFTREHRKLGALSLAVPSAQYDRWVTRIDLSKIALDGTMSIPSTRPETSRTGQEDQVFARVRKHRRTKYTGTE